MSEISLAPVGREQIHRLESALLIGSILRPEVLEMLRDPEERLTWVDSLAVAAAALAREKAKMPVSTIADELGRTEATVRNHLQGRTKAGQIVRETYEQFVKTGINIPLPEIFQQKTKTLDETTREEELNRLKTELEEVKKKNNQLLETISNTVKRLTEILESLKQVTTTAK